MKKFLVFLLTSILILTMSACGEQASTPKKTNKNLLGKWTVVSVDKEKQSEASENPADIGQVFQAMSVIMLFGEKNTVQFFEDTTIKIGLMSGKYRLVDDNNIEVILEEGNSGLIFEMELQNDTLKFYMDKMASITMTRSE